MGGVDKGEGDKGVSDGISSEGVLTVQYVGGKLILFVPPGNQKPAYDGKADLSAAFDSKASISRKRPEEEDISFGYSLGVEFFELLDQWQESWRREWQQGDQDVKFARYCWENIMAELKQCETNCEDGTLSADMQRYNQKLCLDIYCVVSAAKYFRQDIKQLSFLRTIQECIYQLGLKLQWNSLTYLKYPQDYDLLLKELLSVADSMSTKVDASLPAGDIVTADCDENDQHFDWMKRWGASLRSFLESEFKERFTALGSQKVFSSKQLAYLYIEKTKWEGSGMAFEQAAEENEREVGIPIVNPNGSFNRRSLSRYLTRVVTRKGDQVYGEEASAKGRQRYSQCLLFDPLVEAWADIEVPPSPDDGSAKRSKVC